MSKSSDKVIVCMRIKPTGTRFSRRAYEVTPQSLTLSDTHPSVVRRGGKAGREAEYTYNFGELKEKEFQLTCRHASPVSYNHA